MPVYSLSSPAPLSKQPQPQHVVGRLPESQQRLSDPRDCEQSGGSQAHSRSTDTTRLLPYVYIGLPAIIFHCFGLELPLYDRA